MKWIASIFDQVFRRWRRRRSLNPCGMPLFAVDYCWVLGSPAQVILSNVCNRIRSDNMFSKSLQDSPILVKEKCSKKQFSTGNKNEGIVRQIVNPFHWCQYVSCSCSVLDSTMRPINVRMPPTMLNCTVNVIYSGNRGTKQGLQSLCHSTPPSLIS